MAHGPLWVNGNSHITVIAGIRTTPGGVEALVFDPAKPALSHGAWHDFLSAIRPDAPYQPGCQRGLAYIDAVHLHFVRRGVLVSEA